jgi:hypothetical protein
MDNIKNVWGFVEKYYPNYYGCNLIADNDDYQKIVDMELSGEAEQMYNDEYEGMDHFFGGTLDAEQLHSEVIKHFEALLYKSNAYIYSEAIEGYLALSGPGEVVVDLLEDALSQITFEMLFGLEYGEELELNAEYTLHHYSEEDVITINRTEDWEEVYQVLYYKEDIIFEKL